MAEPLDARIGTAMKAVVALGALCGLVGGTLYGPRAGLGTALGAAIAVTNLYALARIVRALSRPGASRSVAGWTLAFMVKLLFLFGGVWLLLEWRVVTVLPLAAGYGTLPIGIAIGSLVSDKASPEDPGRA